MVARDYFKYYKIKSLPSFKFQQVPDFLTTSLTDGLRLSWNLWPHPPLSSLQNKTGAQLAAQVFQGPSGSNSLINSIFSGLPSSSLAALTPGNEKLPLPISALYTPAADLDLSRRPPNSFELRSQPQICSNNSCRAILNPFWYFLLINSDKTIN